MAKIETPVKNRMYNPSDYRRVLQMRIAEPSTAGDSGKMILEGRAVIFDEATVLFALDGVEYKEIITKGAFDETDISRCCFKYNHSDAVMIMARVKSGTLKIEVRDDGLWFNAEIADTTAGRDLYELVKRGDVDEMSFAFTIREESYDAVTHTWTVRKVDKLYDVAAVDQPAYGGTQLQARNGEQPDSGAIIYARRYGEVVARRELEAAALELQRKKALLRLKINKN